MMVLRIKKIPVRFKKSDWRVSLGSSHCACFCSPIASSNPWQQSMPPSSTGRNPRLRDGHRNTHLATHQESTLGSFSALGPAGPRGVPSSSWRSHWVFVCHSTKEAGSSGFTGPSSMIVQEDAVPRQQQQKYQIKRFLSHGAVSLSHVARSIQKHSVFRVPGFFFISSISFQSPQYIS